MSTLLGQGKCHGEKRPRQRGVSREVGHAAGHGLKRKGPKKQCQAFQPSTHVLCCRAFLEAQILFSSLTALMTNGTPIGPNKGR